MNSIQLSMTWSTFQALHDNFDYFSVFMEPGAMKTAMVYDNFKMADF